MRLVNHDLAFNQASRPPIVVNHFNTDTKEGKEELNKLLYIRYQGDTLDVVPTCDCGALTGEYNADIVCEICHTTPRSVTEKPLESTLWIEPPDGVIGFINPTVWIILTRALDDNGQHMLEWMCSPTYTLGHEPRHRMRKLIDLYQEKGFLRGLNYFITNFDMIFGVLVENKLLYNNKKQASEVLVQFVVSNRASLFPTHLPLPSRLNFITEDTVTGRYADTSMTTALDAALTISGISNSAIPLSPRIKEARTVKTIMLLAEFYENVIGRVLGKKEGWWRKHVFGSRLHLTARAVITSLSDNHEYDGLHFPWSASVMLFKTHLISKLIKRGYTPNEAIRFIHENTLKYNELMDSLLQELLDEGFGDPYGVPILLNRNPSLQRGSIQCLRITEIKKDPSINSISLSVLVLVGFNADYDGDALNATLIPDKRLYEHCKRLSPHLSSLDLRRPRAISNNLKMPAPVVMTISNWLHSDL